MEADPQSFRLRAEYVESLKPTTASSSAFILPVMSNASTCLYGHVGWLRLDLHLRAADVARGRIGGAPARWRRP